jgi:CheY-like chemotaxis protein
MEGSLSGAEVNPPLAPRVRGFDRPSSRNDGRFLHLAPLECASGDPDVYGAVQSDRGIAGTFRVRSHAEEASMPGDSILVVDDNAFNATLVSMVLSSAGYVAQTASGASEVGAILERYRPRLILMDLQMPDVDGYELTRRIKNDPRTRHIIVVAFTSIAPEEGAPQAKAAGCDGYIVKTFDPQALPGQVEEYLRAADGA